ncbi:hypothetical protein TRFO_25685 [Tritrichomonas foetus]|uniref:Uncharacterized protein n=1 Tax=Tritrichomonas foetus TaxID=1144522 RepID=A0A1J4K9C7_9EUKA|nr:hypothetical protein TRFO_25685 [Tritrichomonas foetus]|eukprot:OHT06278.1 hypothetical protein TRFO_25685 [Tritrichomonas foetus]
MLNSIISELHFAGIPSKDEALKMTQEQKSELEKQLQQVIVTFREKALKNVLYLQHRIDRLNEKVLAYEEKHLSVETKSYSKPQLFSKTNEKSARNNYTTLTDKQLEDRIRLIHREMKMTKTLKSQKIKKLECRPVFK